MPGKVHTHWDDHPTHELSMPKTSPKDDTGGDADDSDQTFS